MAEPAYERIAKELLAAPNPTMAIAYELADQHARLDGALRRIKALESRLTFLTGRSDG